MRQRRIYADYVPMTRTGQSSLGYTLAVSAPGEATIDLRHSPSLLLRAAKCLPTTLVHPTTELAAVPRSVSGRSVSARDTAGCRRLQEPVACPAAAGGVRPLPICPGELALEPVAESGTHVGHGRPLQRQGLLAGEPELEALDVTTAPSGDDRPGGACGSTPSSAQVSAGHARSSTLRSARNTSRLGVRSGGWSAAHTAPCRLAAAQPDAAARPGQPPAPRQPRRPRQVRGAGRGSSLSLGRLPGSRRERWCRAAPLACSWCW
jgi:hypothetical protein